MVRWVAKYCDPVAATGWHMVLGGLPLLALALVQEGGEMQATLSQLTGERCLLPCHRVITHSIAQSAASACQHAPSLLHQGGRTVFAHGAVHARLCMRAWVLGAEGAWLACLRARRLARAAQPGVSKSSHMLCISKTSSLFSQLFPTSTPM
jgi:hypothetical protein